MWKSKNPKKDSCSVLNDEQMRSLDDHFLRANEQNGGD